MKFVCPKCDLGGSIDDSSLPDGGAWATCPQCKERFHVKKDSPGEFAFYFEQNTSAPSNPNSQTDGNSFYSPAQPTKITTNINIKLLAGLIFVAMLSGLTIYITMKNTASINSNSNSLDSKTVTVEAPSYDVRLEINKREVRIREIDDQIATIMSISSSVGSRHSIRSDGMFKDALEELDTSAEAAQKAKSESDIYKLKTEREMIMEQLKLLYQQQITGK